MFLLDVGWGPVRVVTGFGAAAGLELLGVFLFFLAGCSLCFWIPAFAGMRAWGAVVWLVWLVWLDGVRWLVQGWVGGGA